MESVNTNPFPAAASRSRSMTRSRPVSKSRPSSGSPSRNPKRQSFSPNHNSSNVEHAEPQGSNSNAFGHSRSRAHYEDKVGFPSFPASLPPVPTTNFQPEKKSNGKVINSGNGSNYNRNSNNFNTTQQYDNFSTYENAVDYYDNYDNFYNSNNYSNSQNHFDSKSRKYSGNRDQRQATYSQGESESHKSNKSYSKKYSTFHGFNNGPSNNYRGSSYFDQGFPNQDKYNDDYLKKHYKRNYPRAEDKSISNYNSKHNTNFSNKFNKEPTARLDIQNKTENKPKIDYDVSNSKLDQPGNYLEMPKLPLNPSSKSPKPSSKAIVNNKSKENSHIAQNSLQHQYKKQDSPNNYQPQKPKPQVRNDLWPEVIDLPENNWFFVPNDLEKKAPSILSRMSNEHELAQRYNGVENIFKLANHLRLVRHTVLAASIMFHRFYMIKTFQNYDYHIMAPTFTFIATKTEENHRGLENIALAATSVNSKRSKPPINNEKLKSMKEYWSYKDRIKINEEIALEVLCFDLNFDFPDNVISNVFQKELEEMKKNNCNSEDHLTMKNKFERIFADAKLILDKLIHFPVSVLYNHEEIAAICIIYSLSLQKQFQLPSYFFKKHFPSIKATRLEEISNNILKMYKKLVKFNLFNPETFKFPSLTVEEIVILSGGHDQDDL
ncbi:Bur2p ASCRUDRAFT_74628 [Ascoidea rubescens DSM 1968]|uniref:Cyclin N-terminal domain-containing protein n=1 Tax=Ascoidea rubescens DSM 1968 TaxID=1344418 RepID=A0A1D2VKT4_9ASCO|nr:hypothetical protein ASCRUDRAFT_74628 [Ascoidea rubescens DSM 1968]ODV62188.1 hypothetical protein ASCRUDRAFT_74628 [Ascoidea rubescens DSM 1968]